MKSFPYVNDDIDNKIPEFDFVRFESASSLILFHQIGP